MQTNWKIQRGISLIEILVVVSIFAVLGVIVTRSVILTLQGSKKSDSLVSARENLDYSMSIIERQVRNADSIECPNPNIPTSSLTYHDQNGNKNTLSCLGSPPDSYVASGSGNLRLTSDAISITNCSSAFTCNLGDSTSQSYVDVSLTAQSSTLVGAQSSAVTASTRIYLRAY